MVKAPAAVRDVQPSTPHEAEASGHGKEPRVAVLLAAHNGMEFIRAQVDTVLHQRDVSVTLIISVDESADGTREWVDALARDDARVRVLVGQRRFGSASANFFALMLDLDASEFDHVALSDQDDIWLPGKLAHAVAEMARHGCGGYSGSVLAWYEEGRVRLLRKAGRQRRWDHLFSSPGPGCTHVLRADVFAGFQEVLRHRREQLPAVEYHDWLDYAYVRQRGYSWYIDPKPQMLYRQHQTNQLGANVGLRAKIRRLNDVRRGWMWVQAPLVCELVGAESSLPYRLMQRGGLWARLALASIAPRCRRSTTDAALLGISFLVTSKPRAR